MPIIADSPLHLKEVICFQCCLYFMNNWAFISNRLQVPSDFHLTNYLLGTCKANFGD